MSTIQLSHLFPRFVCLSAASAVLVGSLAWLGMAGAVSMPAARQLTTPAENASDVQDLVYLAESGPIRFRLHLRIDNKPYLAAWQEFVAALFNQLDVNHDGFLGKEEIARLPPPQLFFGGGQLGSRVSEPIDLATLDADHDGKVSLAELGAYFRGNGGAPFSVQVSAGGPAGPEPPRIRGQQAVTTDAYNEALFDLLDANKDGKLSRDELAAAPAVLLQRDENEDEMLTPDEIPPFARANRPAPTAPALAETQNGAILVAITPGESGLTLARRLQARYCPPGGKKATRQRLGLDEKSFKQLDADQDGLLDLEELSRFNRLPPDHEVTIRLRSGPAPGGRLELVRATARPRVGAGSARMMKDGSVSLAIGAASLALRFRDDGRTTRYRALLTRRFKALDTDGTGYLDMAKAQGAPVFANLFKLIDRDRDGKIYEKELLAFLDELEPLQTRAMFACVLLSVDETGRGLFDLLDRDHDGRLSVREMRNAVNLLDGLDRDGDGLLARAEIPRGFEFNVGFGSAAGAPARRLRNVAGRLSQQGRRTQATGPTWFRRMDRNGDGDVSRREFLGTDEQFAQIDTDGDGLISLEEAEKADAAFRSSAAKRQR